MIDKKTIAELMKHADERCCHYDAVKNQQMYDYFLGQWSAFMHIQSLLLKENELEVESV